MAAKRKLTPEQDVEIYRRKAEHPDLSNKALADEYGVDESAISRAVVRGRKSTGGDQGGDVPAPAASSPAMIATAPHGALIPSPLNPRKRFDPDAQEQLAASVAEKGILLPLLVRRANQPGNAPVDPAAEFEIIAGERRWRAGTMLIGEGTWEPGHPIPIRLLDPCDDATLLELALIENMDRKDMTPWEEAEGFARLRELGRPAAAIAKALGLNKRTVEMRLRLFRDLSPLAQDALREGTITVEQANVMAAFAPLDAQPGWLEKIANGWFRTTRDLKLAVTKEMVPTEIAIFALTDYTGLYVEDDDGDPRYFADFSQFRRLQAAAIDALIARYQAKGLAWVKVFDERKGEWFPAPDYAEQAGHPKAGIAIKVAANHAVTVLAGLVALKDMQAPAAQAAPNPTLAAAMAGGLIPAAGTPNHAAGAEAQGGDPWTRAHLLHAKRRQSAAMQNAVAADRDAAMRLVCHALLLEASGVVAIRGTHHAGDTMEIAPGPATEVEAFLATLDGAWEIGPNGPRAGHFTDAAMVWRGLAGVKGTALDRLFAALVALRISAYNGHAPDAWTGTEAMAIAGHLGLVGAETGHGLAIRPGDCDGLRREALLTIKRQACPDDQVSDLGVKELADFLPRNAPDWYVVPTLRFLPDRAAVDRAFRENASHPDQIDIEAAIAESAVAPSGDLEIGIANLRRVLSAHSIFAANAEGETGFPELVGEEDFAKVAEDLARTFGAPTITADVLYTIEDLDHLAVVIENHRAAMRGEKTGEAA